jgi:hypothetical protein
MNIICDLCFTQHFPSFEYVWSVFFDGLFGFNLDLNSFSLVVRRAKSSDKGFYFAVKKAIFLVSQREGRIVMAHHKSLEELSELCVLLVEQAI